MRIITSSHWKKEVVLLRIRIFSGLIFYIRNFVYYRNPRSIPFMPEAIRYFGSAPMETAWRRLLRCENHLRLFPIQMPDSAMISRYGHLRKLVMKFGLAQKGTGYSRSLSLLIKRFLHVYTRKQRGLATTRCMRSDK